MQLKLHANPCMNTQNILNIHYDNKIPKLKRKSITNMINDVNPAELNKF